MPTPADKQVYNPLGYNCRPNEASPNYVAYDDFRLLTGYGLIVSWFSHTPDDPNGDCNFTRPVTRQDVLELRRIFLKVLSDTVYYLWKDILEPGEGDLDLPHDPRMFIGLPDDARNGDDDVTIEWCVSLRDDAICLSMRILCPTDDDQAIWLSYAALEKRWYVLATLREAYTTVGVPLAQPLIDLVPYVDQLRAAVWLNCDRALDVSNWNEDDCIKWLDAEGAEIPRRQLFCRECGEPMRIDDDGVSHHLGDDRDLINYDLDADHTAVRDDVAI